MEVEDGYRRGTVLGLTIAEIFVLLVFLMLLALLGVNRYWNERFEPWRDIMEKSTPEEVGRALEQPNELRREIERLNRQIEELKKEKERLQDRIRTLVAREGTVGEELDETKRQLAECERALEDAKRKIETLTSENQRLRATNNELQGRTDDLEDQIRIIGKGTTPPCWYQVVEETNPITKANRREKAYYLFDIVIREDHMEVQPAPIPEGRAEDDDGKPYAEEAKDLELEAIPYGVPLADREVSEVMRRLYEMGKSSGIRTYSCAFYVRVWDETPATAKDRWKRAHDDVLEQRFGTYQVRDFSWGDRDRNPANVPKSARVDVR